MQNETIKHVSPVSGIFIKKNVVNFFYNHMAATFFLSLHIHKGYWQKIMNALISSVHYM